MTKIMQIFHFRLRCLLLSIETELKTHWKPPDDNTVFQFQFPMTVPISVYVTLKSKEAETKVSAGKVVSYDDYEMTVLKRLW